MHKHYNSFRFWLGFLFSSITRIYKNVFGVFLMITPLVSDIDRNYQRLYNPNHPQINIKQIQLLFSLNLRIFSKKYQRDHSEIYLPGRLGKCRTIWPNVAQRSVRMRPSCRTDFRRNMLIAGVEIRLFSHSPDCRVSQISHSPTKINTRQDVKMWKMKST